MFDMLMKGLKPEMLLDMLSHMMSPTQKALVMTVPKLAGEIYDLTKRPVPAFSIARRGKQVYVIYDFPTEEDATAFENAENDALRIVKVVMEEADKIAKSKVSKDDK